MVEPSFDILVAHFGAMLDGNEKLDQRKLEVCKVAADMLRAAGFALVSKSERSEACYYRFAGFERGVIRVAAHRHRRAARYEATMPVLATLTIGKHCIRAAALRTVVEQTIGRYFIAHGQMLDVDPAA